MSCCNDTIINGVRLCHYSVDKACITSLAALQIRQSYTIYYNVFYVDRQWHSDAWEECATWSWWHCNAKDLRHFHIESTRKNKEVYRLMYNVHVRLHLLIKCRWLHIAALFWQDSFCKTIEWRPLSAGRGQQTHRDNTLVGKRLFL